MMMLSGCWVASTMALTVSSFRESTLPSAMMTKMWYWRSSCTRRIASYINGANEVGPARMTFFAIFSYR